jgi:hypothetical protein
MPTMRVSFWKTSWLLLALSAVIGCESSSPRPTSGGAVSGSVDEAVGGEGRTAALIWMVSTGSPDYAYKLGEGTIAKGKFSITLAGDPPAEAINSFGLGIAMVLVPPPGEAWPDGRLPQSVFNSTIAGISARNSVIWRTKSLDFGDAGIPADFWGSDFPPGLSCGVCTPAPPGSSFEEFAPSACDQLRISAYAQEEVCDWT